MGGSELVDMPLPTSYNYICQIFRISSYRHDLIFLPVATTDSKFIDYDISLSSNDSREKAPANVLVSHQTEVSLADSAGLPPARGATSGHDSFPSGGQAAAGPLCLPSDRRVASKRACPPTVPPETVLVYPPTEELLGKALVFPLTEELTPVDIVCPLTKESLTHFLNRPPKTRSLTIVLVPTPTVESLVNVLLSPPPEEPSANLLGTSLFLRSRRRCWRPCWSPLCRRSRWR